MSEVGCLGALAGGSMVFFWWAVGCVADKMRMG
jgi:hypothetical protein